METDLKPTAAHALRAIVAAGEAAGYWTHAPRADYGDWSDGSARTHVTDNAGRLFGMRVGGWRSEGKCTADVANLDPRGFNISAGDIYPRLPAPEASASTDRPAAVVAKTLHARVTGHADGAALADALRATLSERQAAHARLVALVDALYAQGYRAGNRISDDEPRVAANNYSQATMHGTNSPGMEVYANGTFSLMHKPRSMRLDRLPALLALMNEAEPAPLLLSLAERAALATCVRATTDELGVVDHEHDTELAALRSALVKLEEGPTP